MRNKIFWIGFIYFIIMLTLFFIVRFYDVFVSNIDTTFTYDPIFYIIPVTFMLGGIIRWEKNPPLEKKLSENTENYLNNALRLLDKGDIEGAKSEIKWSLIASQMKVDEKGE